MPQHRTLNWLHHYGREFPEAWTLFAETQQRHMAEERFEEVVARGGTPNAHQWPSWCWAPLVVAHFIVTKAKNCLGYLGPIPETGALGAVAAWRATQGVYRLDATLFKELFMTPVTGKLPAEVLTRLPEWCAYVEVPQEVELGFDLEKRSIYLSVFPLPGLRKVCGFFVYVDWVPPDANPEGDGTKTILRIALDCEGVETLYPLFLEIREGDTIEEAMHRTVRWVTASTQRMDAVSRQRATNEKLVQRWEQELTLSDHFGVLGRILSLVLYLCADETDVPRPMVRPLRAVKTQKGRWILPTPHCVQFYDCGARLGSELRWAREYYKGADRELAATDQVEPPRIRAAHWHTFLSPLDQQRTPRVKWLPPLRIKPDGTPEMPPVRPVR